MTGRGTFADDVVPPGALYCAILRSNVPHARIVHVDTRAAKELPGVITAISGKEAKAHWRPLPPAVDYPGTKLSDTYGLATGKVLFDGEPVAAVLAETRYVAEDALALLDVEYEPLPALLTLTEALGDETGPPKAILHEEWEDNIQLQWGFSYGDPDTAFADADVVVEERVRTHRYSGVPLEPRAVTAFYDATEGILTVHISTQQPFQTRSLLATIFDLPERNVRVVARDVGGGFGNKGRIYAEVVPILLAILSGRPVKWMETRTENITSGPHARDYAHEMRAAFDGSGRLLALRDHHYADVGCDGAIRAPGSSSVVVGGLYVPGPYRVQHYEVSVAAVVTNKAPYGAYRGFGKDNANLAIEVLMDRAARKLEIDPIELRRRNLVDQFPYEMCTGPVLESGSFRECLDDLVELMNLEELRRMQTAARSGDPPRYLGIGVVSFLEPSGAAFPNSVTSGFESATVRMAPDGSVTVLSGMQNIGQGVETAIAQVAADRLGCTTDDVRVVCGDTDSVPIGLGSYSSRGATFGLSAVYEAASEVRRRLLKAAATLLEARAEDLTMGDNRIWVRGSPTSGMSITEVAGAVYFTPGPYTALPDERDRTLESTSVWTSEHVKWEPDQAGRTRMYITHASGAMGALVEVDIETGEVNVHRIWVAHDVGTIINPAVLDAQLKGGVIQGVGGALMEEFKYSSDGYLLTRTISDYRLPNVLSVPPIEIVHRETKAPGTPLGAKGAGEGGAIPSPTVIMLAVEDALRPVGVIDLETPFTPPKILEAIHSAEREEASR